MASPAPPPPRLPSLYYPAFLTLFSFSSDWATWDFFDWATGKAWYTFGTASKARKLGWTRYDDTYECWTKTWQAFENSGALPTRTAEDVAKVEAMAHRQRTELLPHPAEAVLERQRKLELRQ